MLGEHAAAKQIEWHNVNGRADDKPNRNSLA
jgi:hypothetical protein